MEGLPAVPAQVWVPQKLIPPALILQAFQAGAMESHDALGLCRAPQNATTQDPHALLCCPLGSVHSISSAASREQRDFHRH